jgi:hypothetical protein
VEPASWIVIQTLVALFYNIQIANGFHTDAGNNVTEEPFQANADDSQNQYGVICVAEDATDSADDAGSLRAGEMDVSVEVYYPVEEDNAQHKAHLVRDDIVKAIPTRTGNMPEGIHTITITSRRIYQRPAGFPFIAVQVVLRVGFTESAFKNR